MTRSGDGAAPRPLRAVFDHVQVAVSDLDVAARTLREEHGLVAVAGGRHPGRGTANMIVPLGDSYLELIAVVDRGEAGGRPTSMRVARAVEQGRTFAVWSARVDDLDGARAALAARGLELPDATAGARLRPDGVELRWRMQELVPDARFSPLPFLIDWALPPELYPGALPARHARRVHGVAGVRLSDPEPAGHALLLASLLDDGLACTVERGPSGVSAVVLDTEDGPLELT